MSTASSSNLISLAQQKEIDAIADRFDKAWRGGGHPRIESYLSDSSGLPSDALLYELLLAELTQQVDSGHRPDLPDYLRRFPEHTSSVKHAFRCFQTMSLPNASDGPDEIEQRGHIGKYRVIRRIGEGNFGTVYECHDEHLSRAVALKVLHNQMFVTAADCGDRVQWESRAAAAAAQADNPGICPVYDAGCIDSVHYIAMAYIDGGSLKEALECGIEQQEAVRILHAVANSIHKAHQHGCIHGDLKPENIMLNGEAKPFITDFGFARRTDVKDDALRAKVTGGSPAYMAPELVGRQNTEPHARHDIYSLGVILHEALVGQRPNHQNEDRHNFSRGEAFRALPERLQRITLKALAVSPQQRYQTMEEFASDLQFVLIGEPRKRQALFAFAGLLGTLAVGTAAAIALHPSMFTRAKDAVIGHSEDAEFVSASRPADLSIMPNDAKSAQAYGYSVAIHGDTLVVGAPHADNAGEYSGTVFTFRKTFGGQWKQEAQLASDDLSAGDHFGNSVAVHNDVIVVGAWQSSSERGGVAYVFQRNGVHAGRWAQVARLDRPSRQSRDRFANSVAVFSDTIVVGAHADNLIVDGKTANSCGTAWVYERNHGGPDHWACTAELRSPVPTPNELFGHSVDVASDTIVVSGIGSPKQGVSQSAVYVFERSGKQGSWKHCQTIAPEDPKAGKLFGASMTLGESSLIVSSPGYLKATDPGGVFVFSRNVQESNAWSLDAKLSPVKFVHHFGRCIAISPDEQSLAISGMYRPNSKSRCVVQIYERVDSRSKTWNLVDTIDPENALSARDFGHSVAITGRTALIGDFSANDGRGTVSAYRMPSKKYSAATGVFGD